MATAATLFKNVLIFNGTDPTLSEPSCVLVEGNMISKIVMSTEISPVPPDAKIIDGQGQMILMPGLSDAHYHLNLAAIDMTRVLNPATPLTDVESYIWDISTTTAAALIDMGFTSIRDAGGNTYRIVKEIDAGNVVGPRVYPSGTFLTQTSGHFDFRNGCCWLHDLSGNSPGPFEIPKLPTSPLGRAEILGESRVVDGVPEMLRATRENLMKGSTQIKIATGGGVSSMYDPVDVAQFTAEEIKACSDAAGDWNTYVLTHCYTARSIIRSVTNGVKCIEHGMLMDEESAKLMADKDVWLSIQPLLDDEDATFPEGSSNPVTRKKFVTVTQGTLKAYELARKYKLKTAFGTDTLFSAGLVQKEGKMVAKLCKVGYTPAEALIMATSTNCDLFKMCGPRDPYPDALFGRVQEACYADIILVDGNPLEDINVIADKNNIKVVMKDGKVFKNTLV